MKENKRNIIAIFMVMLFACYHISIVSFAHVHNINGTSILHSHPFSDSGNNHTHDTSEISLINSLTTNPYILYSDLNIDLSEVLEIKDKIGRAHV